MKSRTLSLGPTACPGVSAGLGTEGGEGWGGVGTEGCVVFWKDMDKLGCVCVCVLETEN